MSSNIGDKIKISIFGESHGAGIGVVIDSPPPGIKIDFDELYSFMDRRKGGKNNLSTARSESDMPKIISGAVDGVTCGTPLCAIIENSDTISKDYSNIKTVARPGHADYTGYLRYKGFNDIRGGGHFSGRITAPLVFAGGLFKQILKQKGITIGAHVYSVGEVYDESFDSVNITSKKLNEITSKSIPVIDDKVAFLMANEIEKARLDCNSVGGVVECCAVGVPAGIGSPMFDGLESVISKIVFGIPAVKGLSFGNGFDAAKITGDQNNDEFYIDNGMVKTKTNNHGGILGGISTGMPIVMKVAFKPTPSIAKAQNTVDFKDLQNTEIQIKGRHDPCVALRAVPCVESALAIALMEVIEWI